MKMDAERPDGFFETEEGKSRLEVMAAEFRQTSQELLNHIQSGEWQLWVKF